MTHHSDLASVAKALQEASHALQILSMTTAPDVPEKPHTAAARTSAPDREGEIRSYYFSPASVQQERELLRIHHAQTFQDLLEKAHALLLGQVTLMKEIPK